MLRRGDRLTLPAFGVSTGLYRESDDPETLALKLHGTRRFDEITLDSFTRLENKVGAAKAGLAEVAAEAVERASGVGGGGVSC